MGAWHGMAWHGMAWHGIGWHRMGSWEGEGTGGEETPPIDRHAHGNVAGGGGAST